MSAVMWYLRCSISKRISLRDYLVIFEELVLVMAIGFLFDNKTPSGSFLILLMILLERKELDSFLSQSDLFRDWIKIAGHNIRISFEIIQCVCIFSIHKIRLAMH